MDVAVIGEQDVATFKGKFYVSRGDEWDSMYLREDGTWHIGMDTGAETSKGRGTYFNSQSEAVQCCELHGIQYVIKGNENGG